MRNDETPDYWRERTVFPGVVPKEVKLLVKNIPNLEKSFFRKLINVALGYLQNTILPDQCEIAFENLCKLKDCSTEKDIMELSALYSGTITLLRAVLKINLKTVSQQTLACDLLEIGIPEEFSADICSVVFGPAHNEIFSDVVFANPHIIRMECMEWKVLPTLASSGSGKMIEPMISFEMKTSDGERNNFEVPITSFHQLRHSTATILHHMENLQRKK